MKEVVITSKVVGREGAGIPAKIGQGSTVDLSAYLLKAIWDKVWEIRTDSTGQEYIFGKLPVVTQYGITMYAGDGGDIDLPSLYAGLPIDNTTIYWENGVLKAVGSSGGGVADSVAWGNVTGKPSWITDTKPTYAYSEITGTPDLTKYALKADIPSLSGYATESWVIGKGYALDADLDALTATVGNKADKTELAKYIPISGYTEVSGEKNFTGGLKVNGSPIYYDATNKYWKLEGDLLVTGGVTMYANEGTYTPSTIMDALLYDDTTLGINSEGKLYVKGGSGGGLDITELQNYLTQNSYLNVTEGDSRYLKLSGGTITTQLKIESGYENKLILNNNGAATYNQYIDFRQSNTTYGLLGTNGGTDLLWNEQKILHAGNYSSYALPLTGGTLNSGTIAPLSLQSPSSSNQIVLQFYRGINYWGALGFDGENSPMFKNTAGTNYSIWHTGNFTPSNYLPLSGGTLTGGILFGDESTGANKKASNTRFPSHIYRNVFDTAGNVYDHYYNSGYTNSTYTYANLRVKNGTSYQTLQFGGDGSFTWAGNRVWHAGNDGSGSGLDADLLDGLHSNGFLKQYGLITNANSGNAVYSGTFRFDKTKDGLPSGATSWGTMLTVRGSDYFDTLWQMYGNYDNYGLFYRASNLTDITSKAWKQIAFTDSNVASATKLQTARTIWGQSFDGTGNITGQLNITTVNNVALTHGTGSLTIGPMSGVHIAIDTNDIQAKSNGTTASTLYLNDYGGNVSMCRVGGNVGVGTASPAYKFHVAGDSYLAGVSYINKYTAYDSQPYTANPLATARIGTFDHRGGLVIQFGSAADTNVNGRFEIIDKNWTVALFSVDTSGNVKANGGITMYSDQRKKTILRNVELSLKDVANAPLIEHYYNSDDKKTTHVGSIAQYWAGLNDWFCKLDNEGYYTMEIQNAALASAISVARELDRYETKTDKAIKKLKKRICELEEEVERLKAN